MKNQELLGQLARYENTDFCIVRVNKIYAHCIPVDADIESVCKIKIKDLKFFTWERRRKYFNINN